MIWGVVGAVLYSGLCANKLRSGKSRYPNNLHFKSQDLGIQYFLLKVKVFQVLNYENEIKRT